MQEQNEEIRDRGKERYYMVWGEQVLGVSSLRIIEVVPNKSLRIMNVCFTLPGLILLS